MGWWREDEWDEAKRRLDAYKPSPEAAEIYGEVRDFLRGIPVGGQGIVETILKVLEVKRRRDEEAAAASFGQFQARRRDGEGE